MLYTLKEFMRLLYEEEGGISLEPRKKMEELEFLKRFFPDELREGYFHREKGKSYTLSTMFSGNGAGPRSQRSKIFSGSYRLQALYRALLGIFSQRPDLWEQCRALCQRELLGFDRDLLREHLEAIRDSVQNREYRLFLREAIETDLATALGTVILYLMVKEDHIGDLMPVFEGTVALEEQFAYLDMPKKMMKESFQNILEPTEATEAFEKLWRDYSELLSLVTRVTLDGDEVEDDGDLLDLLYEGLTLSDVPYAMKIVGPSAAEKNAITELLYLRLSYEVRAGKVVGLAPYYLNLGYYRSQDLQDFEEIRRQLLADLQPFLEFHQRQPLRTPVLFVDGIKCYAFDQQVEVDFMLNELLRDLFREVRYVVAVEQGVEMNAVRQRQMPAFVCGDYQYVVTMESVYLTDTERARNYLRKFVEIYAAGEKRDLMRRLQKLRLEQIDTFQLRLLLPMLFSARNIVGLYEGACLDYLGGDRSGMDAAVQWAYTYAYTRERPEPLSFEVRNLINLHDSFLEFFLSKWYLRELRKAATGGDLDALDLVLPKGVTRFVRAALGTSRSDQLGLLELVETRGGDLGVWGRAEMAYWLGRIQAPALLERADSLLERMFLEEQALLENMETRDQAWREQMLLCQSIAVSLTERGDEDALDWLLETLIHDDDAGEVNRSFQLSFFGDVPFLPTGGGLPLKDEDLTVGRRALDQLLAANDHLMGEDNVPLRLEYNLFTVCSLLQARIEAAGGPGTRFRPCLKRALEQLDWYLGSGICDTALYWDYFRMVYRDFRYRLEEKKAEDHIGSAAFLHYTRRVVQPDWADRAIPEPESAAEHAYGAWLLGMMFLPETLKGVPEYRKARVLELLLLHDLAEANPFRSDGEWADQDGVDHTELGLLLLKGTYPGLPAQEDRYQLWQDWNDPDSLEGRIARELSGIQTLHTMLGYYTAGKGGFTPEDLLRAKAACGIGTEPGRHVFDIVISGNREYREALEAARRY